MDEISLGVAPPTGTGSAPGPWAELWAWRRTVADLYGHIRGAPPEGAWRRWRETRDRLFADHPQSPLDPGRRAAFENLPCFDYDPALRFLTPLVAVETPQTHSVEVGADGGLKLTAFATTQGLAEALGAELTLYWIGGYGGGVFLPFRDATSGRETYGGGRYLLDTIKGADLGHAPDGRAILDFNFAYNPSCAYADRWICPLAPQENTLTAPIRAGEKTPAALDRG